MSTPSHHTPSDPPELPATGSASAQIPPEAFVEMAETAQFKELQRRFRTFAFPMTAAFLIWYFAYVLMSVYARDFMSTPLPGMQYFNLGHGLGLLQFVTTFLITWLYLRHMNKSIDPLAAELRAKLEGSKK